MENRIIWSSSNHFYWSLMEILLWIHELLLLHVCISSIWVNRSFIDESRKCLNWLFLSKLNMVLLLYGFLSEVIHDWHCFILFSSFPFIFFNNVRCVWVRHVSVPSNLMRIFFSRKHKSCWILVLEWADHSTLLSFEVFFMILKILNFLTLCIKWTWIVHQ